MFGAFLAMAGPDSNTLRTTTAVCSMVTCDRDRRPLSVKLATRQAIVARVAVGALIEAVARGDRERRMSRTATGSAKRSIRTPRCARSVSQSSSPRVVVAVETLAALCVSVFDDSLSSNCRVSNTTLNLLQRLKSHSANGASEGVGDVLSSPGLPGPHV